MNTPMGSHRSKRTSTVLDFDVAEERATMPTPHPTHTEVNGHLNRKHTRNRFDVFPPKPQETDKKKVDSWEKNEK